MNGFLLDTNITLISTGAPELLSDGVRAAIERGPAYLSAVVYWEVMIKAMKGTLDVGGPRLWFAQTVEALGLRPLPFRPDHVAAIFALPPIHRDPFDRALIARATAERLTFLTNDATVAEYQTGDFRLIR